MAQVTGRQRETGTHTTSRRRGWLIGSLLLAAGIVAYLVVWLLGTDEGTQRQRLPDGSTVSLLGYTYGSRHEFLYGVRWQKLLWPVLPPTWRNRLDKVCQIYRQNSPPRSLVLWVRQQPPDNNLIVRRMVTAVDERGCELNSEGSDLHGIQGSGGEPACPLPVDLFSRHASTVKVRLYLKNGSGGWVRGADFTVPNPDPGPQASWTAPPLPVSKVVDGLTFMLQRFDTRVGRYLRPGRLQPGEYPCTRITCRVSRKGRTAPNWHVCGLTLADATGNSWTPRMTTSSTSGEVSRYEFHGEVCPDEPYKVRAEFTNQREFTDSDRWTIRNLVLPPRGVVRDPGLSRQYGPVRVSIRQIGGPHSRPPGPEFSDFDRDEALVQVVVSPKDLADERVQLVRAVDQQGRSLIPEISSSWLMQGDSSTENASQTVFALRPLPGVRTVSLTFGIRRSYFVEFLARPTRNP